MSRDRASSFHCVRPDGALSGDLIGRGSTVILLHGWALDRRMWQPQIDALRDDYRLLALDRRGSGESTAPADLALELADLDAIIAVLGGGPVSLVGMSQGGRIALRYAFTRPHLVRNLVLTGAPVDGSPFPPAIPIPIETMRQSLAEGDSDDVRNLWRSHPLMRATDDPGLRALLDTILDHVRWHELLGARGLAQFPDDIFDRIAELSVPTHLIYGVNDQSDLLDTARSIAGRDPAIAFETIAGAGHFVNWTHAEAFNAAVGKALRGEARQCDRSPRARGRRLR